MYDLIEITGSDAEEFLQGQLTQDVALLSREISLPAAWCNPKGRVIVTVRIAKLPDAIGMIVPESMTDKVIARLGMYRLRADVSISLATDDWQAVAVAAEDGFNAAVLTASELIVVDHPGEDRFIELSGTKQQLDDALVNLDAPLSADEWLQHRIRAGLAEISHANTEKFTPHMLNLDCVGAISFDKGCYIGQEVVARTENLGKSKRRLNRYECDAPGIAIGDRLSDGERDVGHVVNVSGAELLAVTPFDLHENNLWINGKRANPRGLPYSL